MTRVARGKEEAAFAEPLGSSRRHPVREKSPGPTVRGKFFFDGERKLYVRGVTYGTFRADANGHEFPAPEVVSRDFEMMAANHVNAVRTYTPPPTWLLDEADHRGLHVMVGLAAERYVGYLSDGRRDSEIAQLVCDHAGACWRHPAILCYAVANEIPAPTVRWLGRRQVERFAARLCDGVREADPAAVVTYVSYPSTEYLQLPFIDVVAFNIYLERPQRLALYLARLQNLAGERPLLMTELGLDSIRNGEEQQATSLASQIQTAFAAGCAGAFAYAWTDEWHRGGEDVDDWGFGLTRRDRRPKPALAAARRAFAATPLRTDVAVPRVSVVVCTFNGARTLGECLDGLGALDYPDYEVIVVNDGSTDTTAAIAASYPVRLITTENRGLSSARNTGLEAATGEIVAYIDDDARPDPHWLRYLAHAFMEGGWAAVGGPNLAPPDDGVVADCIANSPGGPMHVLVSDSEAEHVPGCNMAVRRSALMRIGGFDPRFHVAGDDVDLCWRLQALGLKVGFSPAAVVWHHRRRSVRAYLRQQSGYGKAEALLERKWPQKYNGARHITWGGRVYGKGLTRELTSARRWRVYYGSQGSAPFQSLYRPLALGLRALPLMPEWYLVILALAVLCAIGAAWQPLLFVGGLLLAVAAGAVAGQALLSAAAAQFSTRYLSWRKLLAMRALTALLHVLQPVARLHGRLAHGLGPWRSRLHGRPRSPARRTWAFWSTQWIDPHERLRAIEQRVVAAGARIRPGGDYDRWDIQAELGVLVRERLLMSVEEHAGGAQLIRVRAVLRYWAPLAVGAIMGVLAGAAALDHAYLATALLGGLLVAFLTWLLREASRAAGVVAEAVENGVAMATLLPRSRRRIGCPIKSAPAQRDVVLQASRGADKQARLG
jgi:glycosyltransferase involved in cell wall biosynthesis